MIKNCTSEDGETPAPSFPKSYLDIINCKSAGLAIQSIQASMDQRGHPEVGWPEFIPPWPNESTTPYETHNGSENDGLTTTSWRAPAGNPPQIQLISNVVTTGKRRAAEMLGEFLIPLVVIFCVNVRESGNGIVNPDNVDDYCSAPSTPIRSIVFPLREASEEGNGVTSTKNKVSRIRGATEEGNGVTSISETSRIRGGSDDQVSRICGATEEGSGVTSNLGWNLPKK